MHPRALILTSLLLILAACGGSSPTATGPFLLSAPNSAVLLGGGQIYSLSDGKGNPVSQSSIKWSSSNPAVATINSSGAAAAVAVGDTTITASVGNQSSNPLTLSVVQPKLGVATLAAPTAQNPANTVQIPVMVYNDYALYQGDIIIPLAAVQRTGGGVHLQSDVIPAYKGKLWPNKTLPYVLDANLPQEIKDKVSQTASVYQQKANISLAQIFNPGGDYVYVTLADPKKPICGDSQVGRQGGQQVIHFALGCPLRAYLHEFGHALGLWHEQSRSDRDASVNVLYDNIIDGYKNQYDKSPGDLSTPYGPYDFGSVMHYPVYSGFSKLDGQGNALPTLSANRFFTPADEVTDVGQVGSRNVLSGGDLLALSSLYGHIPPTLTLVSPVGNTTKVDIAEPFGLNLEASASGPNGGCCSFTWYDWKEGVIGSTAQLFYNFKTLGTRLITVTATDNQNASDSVNVAVNVVHANPDTTISAPASNKTVYRNLAFQLQKAPNLAQDGPWAVKCTWSIPGLSSSPTGCATSVLLGNSFPKGPLAITLNVSDKYGGISSSSVKVNVDELATLGVGITDPADSGVATVGDLLFIRSVVVNGQSPVKKVWTWQASKQGCAPQTLTLQPAVIVPINGPVPDGYWDTSKQLNIPNGCGFDNNGGTLTVSVTDGNNQAASASIKFTLSYVPPPN